MASTLVPLFGPVPGGMEMVVILLIAVLLFGANKIPKLARSTGQAMGEFKRGRQQVEEELQELEEVADPEAEIADDEDDEYMDLNDDDTTTTTTTSSQSETETEG
ncbi:twin-arginine translocase TatA/TatE family subunit [Halovenus rubra]|uniref:Twin-arginine translocase TatA/TatE family subunit n=2 Tax=Halovenus rubra TaxID=869890 RepID=A0ACC7E2C2_9EURY|nr:twin-arginine translocase TatA/TatE family subunit [Halovenus rubra]